MKKTFAFKQRETSKNKLPFGVKLFFKDHNMNGYFSKEELVTYAKTLDEVEASRLERAFINVSEGASLDNNLKVTLDAVDGIEVLWLRFSQPKQKLTPFCILYHEAMLRFFRDYQLGKIVPKIDFNDLLGESGYDIYETED